MSGNNSLILGEPFNKMNDMQSKEFNKIALKTIRENFNPLKTDTNKFFIETVFGRLQIILDPLPRIKVYSIMMRYTSRDDFNKPLFNEWLGKISDSLKWNINEAEPYDALDEFEERICNLKYLEDVITPAKVG